MKPITKEWLRKADRDFSTMNREGRVDDSPNTDAITFHAQQGAEKYLKGYLQEIDLPFPKTHDLSVLLELAKKKQSEITSLQNDCNFLTYFAVRFRYPGEDPTLDDAEQAITSCKRIRKLILELLSQTDQMIL